MSKMASKSKMEVPNPTTEDAGSSTRIEEEEEDDEPEMVRDYTLPDGETQVDTATALKAEEPTTGETDEELDMDPCGEEEEEEEEEEVIEVIDNKKRMTLTGPISDEAETDFETLVREEFKKLHRQYRLMENARHAIAGASGKLGKQGKLLERLKEEKEDLLTDLKNARCRAYRMKDKQSINTILEALERYEKYKADITACLLSIAEMETNVDRITQRLVEQRLKVQALYGQSMTVSKADHRKRILEDRLYLATTQTDTLVTHNKELKLDINMMLKLRGSFYRRMVHLKKVSAKLKQRMGEVVYEATAAYDQRDDWVNKINILRERNDKDSKQHVVEIKEFQRVLHHDSKIHEFLAIKNKNRELMENTQQRLERKNKVRINELDQLLLAYKKSFKAILTMANSKDVNSLVNTYLEEEHKNYAMFKFMTDLNHETSFLQEKIAKIKQEIEMLSSQAKETAKSRKETLAEYDEKLEDATSRLEETLNEMSEMDKFLEEFGKLLDDAFNLAGCSNASIVALLGNQGGMGPRNICLCMKALAHRITELLFEKDMLEVRKAVEVDGNSLPKKPQLWVPGQKPAPQGGPFKPIVHVTGRVDSEQEDEESEIKAWAERPIYYNEMKDIINESMQVMQERTDPDARASKAEMLSIRGSRASRIISKATTATHSAPDSKTDVPASTTPSKATTEADEPPPAPESEPEPEPEPEPDPEPEPEPDQEQEPTED